MGRDRSAVRAPDDEALAATFPLDHYKLVAGADGEKSCTYEVRPFISYGGRWDRASRGLECAVATARARLSLECLSRCVVIADGM